MNENDNFVVIKDTDGIRHVSLNRPQKANALCIEMLGDLRGAFESHAAANIRMIVLRSTSSKLFCAGGDIEEFVKGPLQLEQQGSGLRELIGAMARCPVPILAVARGKAAGAGVILLSMVDIVIAAESLSFTCPEIAFNMYPGIVQVALETKIGSPRARQLCLSGQALSASSAKDLGLVTDIFPDEDFETAAEQRLAYFTSRSEALLMARKAWLLSDPAEAIVQRVSMVEHILHENFHQSGVQDTIKSYLAQLRSKKDTGKPPAVGQ